jgi:RNA polymerase-binding transcription factor DksA
MRTHPSESPRDRLLARRSQLLQGYRHATAAAAEVTAEPEIEALDSAGEQWEARVLSRLGDADSRQIAAVIAALDRFAAGTYGKCLHCGHKIGAGRLRALPEASMCNHCATYLERRP